MRYGYALYKVHTRPVETGVWNNPYSVIRLDESHVGRDVIARACLRTPILSNIRGTAVSCCKTSLITYVHVYVQRVRVRILMHANAPPMQAHRLDAKPLQLPYREAALSELL